MSGELNSNDLKVREDIGHLKANSEITLTLIRQLKEDFSNISKEADQRLTKLEHGRVKFAGMVIGVVIMTQVFLGDASKALAKLIGVVP